MCSTCISGHNNIWMAFFWNTKELYSAGNDSNLSVVMHLLQIIHVCNPCYYVNYCNSPSCIARSVKHVIRVDHCVGLFNNSDNSWQIDWDFDKATVYTAVYHDKHLRLLVLSSIQKGFKSTTSTDRFHQYLHVIF